MDFLLAIIAGGGQQVVDGLGRNVPHPIWGAIHRNVLLAFVLVSVTAYFSGVDWWAWGAAVIAAYNLSGSPNALFGWKWDLDDDGYNDGPRSALVVARYAVYPACWSLVVLGCSLLGLAPITAFHAAAVVAVVGCLPGLAYFLAFAGKGPGEGPSELANRLLEFTRGAVCVGSLAFYGVE